MILGNAGANYLDFTDVRLVNVTHIDGRAGNDTVIGGNATLDVLYGGADNDYVYGRAGNDVLEGIEECDDGNNANGDGCNEICETE